jgi:hypothetical protein
MVDHPQITKEIKNSFHMRKNIINKDKQIREILSMCMSQKVNIPNIQVNKEKKKRGIEV